MAYSPDGRLLATVSDDGMMRLIDVTEERSVTILLSYPGILACEPAQSQDEFVTIRCWQADSCSLTDTFASYFGTLNCVAWSYDSRFVAVGGQDDLITILSPRDSRVVARCQSHSAFVTSIAFDPAQRGSGYRFGSVAEDGKLCFVRSSFRFTRMEKGTCIADPRSGISRLLHSIDRDIITLMSRIIGCQTPLARLSPFPLGHVPIYPLMSLQKEASSIPPRQGARSRYFNQSS